MSELLAYIRRLQDAEATLQDAWDAGNIAGALASARREMRELREAMQAEVDRCEAAYARELRDAEAELSRAARGECARCHNGQRELRGGICGDCADDLRLEAQANEAIAAYDAARSLPRHSVYDEQTKTFLALGESGWPGVR